MGRILPSAIEEATSGKNGINPPDAKPPGRFVPPSIDERVRK